MGVSRLYDWQRECIESSGVLDGHSLVFDTYNNKHPILYTYMFVYVLFTYICLRTGILRSHGRR